MVDGVTPLGIIAGTAALAAGIVLLRAGRRVGGWGLVAAGIVLWGVCGAADLTLALAALTFSLVGYTVVAASVQIRTRRGRDRRDRHVGEDPLARPPRPWRTAARVILAGPLSLAFGIALAVLLGTRLPMQEVNAIILGGLLGPVAVAATIAWSLSAERLGRVALGLGSTSLLMTALAVWR